MVNETNLFASQQTATSSRKKWKDLDASDVQAYIGLRIYMGYLPAPTYHDYWAADDLDGNYGLPRKVMSRDKFDLIRSHLHFNNNLDPKAKEDRYWKLRPVIEILDKRFGSVYTPTQKVCVDESLFLYRGRHSAVQFIPSKRSRYGLKVFKLCESDGPATGYTSAFIAYLGGDKQKKKKGDQLYSYKMVVKLLDMAKILDKRYHVYTDNWYSSPTLFHDLQARDTFAVGTVAPKRKFMPKLVVEEKGDIDYASSPSGMLAIAWRDKKRVNLLSTLHQNPDPQEVQCKKPGGDIKIKPQIVLDYNRGKTGVDVSDQMTSYYAIRRKCVKWYQTLFWHLVDQAIVNAFLVWRILGGPNRAKSRQLRFRKELIRSLVGTVKPPGLQTPSKKRPLAPECLLEATTRWRRCVWCKSAWRLRKDTRFWCKQCAVYLCPGHCFNSYHEDKTNTDG